MPLLVAGAKGVMPKRAPIGVYDKDLLCASCEAKFSPVDSYGIDVLLARFDHHFSPLQQGSRTVAYESTTVDKERLLEFLVSILWRASSSNEAFFKTIRLGQLERAAKDSLFSSPVLVPSLFDAVLSKWGEADDGGAPTTAMLNPHREKWDGVNAYRLYLGKVVAYVKVDQRPFGPVLASFSLRAPGPCRLITRELAGSNDLKAMRKTVLTAEANRKARQMSRGKI
jgi:hypothetical protein